MPNPALQSTIQRLWERGETAIRQKNWREAAKAFHVTAQYLLFALILGHAAAAIWHHHVRRDGVLRAMLPAREQA